ncbi:hypothetical protein [Streptomyces halobius]|uniref:Resolvase-like protein n=1 Tax=Streptomyces halobius TaxID=2879846 RepID=A0ABY4MEF5_9ACTN|nr:hypothetical protein [Streptomyces halobius]UQA95702.1 hypothetical protein K9S39_31000 [Streptomyces halobius]
MSAASWAVPPSSTPAALYICARRPGTMSTQPEDKALAEGQAHAERHGWPILHTITDPYDEANPQQRPGWLRVRTLAAANRIGVVITRWPASIAPESLHELRHEEIGKLAADGCTVDYSWSSPISTERA